MADEHPYGGGGEIINAECQVMNGELGRVQRETDCHGCKRPRNDRVITECGGRIGLSAGCGGGKKREGHDPPLHGMW